jgi:hypothetical protein
MAVYTEFSALDVTTTTDFLHQPIDVLQEDISSDVNRRQYQVFVTGAIGSVTSSLYHTVYDQDFTLQTANAIFDMTVGLFADNTQDYYSDNLETTDTAGKEIFGSDTLMMREKLDLYRSFAQTLLGDSSKPFTIPTGSNGASTKNINHALFLPFKRLFARDQIKRQTFVMRSYTGVTGSLPALTSGPNLTTVKLWTDVSSSVNTFDVGGSYGYIFDSSIPDNKVGILFYDKAVAVFDLEKIISTQNLTGIISSVENAECEVAFTNKPVIPDLMVSGSIDDILDHLAVSRFAPSTIPDGTSTAITFQNTTGINSTLFFCRVPPGQGNYSSNPTFTDSSGKINVILDENNDKSFTFITSVGLYDDDDRLLAVAKLSRPVEKSSSNDLTFRVRLDF